MWVVTSVTADGRGSGYASGRRRSSRSDRPGSAIFGWDPETVMSSPRAVRGPAALGRRGALESFGSCATSQSTETRDASERGSNHPAPCIPGYLATVTAVSEAPCSTKVASAVTAQTTVWHGPASCAIVEAHKSHGRRAPHDIAATDARSLAGVNLRDWNHPGCRGLRARRPGGGARGNALWPAFLLAGLAAGLTAYSYARLGAMRPKDSPEFQYTALAFGPRIGFVAGWLMLIADLLAVRRSPSASAATSLTSRDGMVANAAGLLAVTLLVLLAGIGESVKLAVVLTSWRRPDSSSSSSSACRPGARQLPGGAPWRYGPVRRGGPDLLRLPRIRRDRKLRRGDAQPDAKPSARAVLLDGWGHRGLPSRRGVSHRGRRLAGPQRVYRAPRAGGAAGARPGGGHGAQPDRLGRHGEHRPAAPGRGRALGLRDGRGRRPPAVARRRRSARCPHRPRSWSPPSPERSSC